MTEPLSHAAQAVLDAFLKTPGEEPMPGWNYGRDIAAALESAVQQVQSRQYGKCFICDSADLLSIAAELKQ